MPLESATYIHQLVVTNPDGGDPKYSGDDHIRMIKAALKNTWANVNGAVTASHTELNTLVGVTGPIQTQLDSKVGLAGNQTINGIKTFGSLPVLPANATTNMQAVPKQQLDSGIATCVGLSGDQTVAGNKTFSGASTFTGLATFSAGAKVIQSDTAKATTSGTSIDFTPPSWAKRITVMFNGVSTSGANSLLVQIGTGGTPTTSGYISGSFVTNATGYGSASTSTAGFIQATPGASGTLVGNLVITLMSGFTYTESHNTFSGTLSGVGAGSVTLSGVMNILRLTTVGGTDTFDAGSVNVLYEG